MIAKRAMTLLLGMLILYSNALCVPAWADGFP